MLRFALLSLLFIATACGDLHGTSYRGDALATLSGQLSAPESLQVSGDVRMALAWYPNALGSDSPLTRPASMVLGDVEESRTFPLNYRLNLYTPPPEAALADFSALGLGARSSLGIVLIYEDRNGNGKLDTFSALDAAPDRVIGSSYSFFKKNGTAVLYVDADQASLDGPIPGVKPGFNLATDKGIVPLDTQIPIALTGAPDLMLFACEELFEQSQLGTAGPCGYKPDSIPTVRISGSTELIDGTAAAKLDVLNEDDSPFVGAVTFAGAVMANGSHDGEYVIRPEDAVSLQPATSYEIVVHVSPAQEYRETFTFPGDFSITTPTTGATLPTGSTVSASWTASTGADGYEVSWESSVGVFFFEETTQLNFTSSQPVTDSGPATVKVNAKKFGGATSSVFTSVGHSVPVTFSP